MTDTVTGCAKTPLSDLLRRIPQEAVYNWTNPEEGRELWRLGSESAPIGRLAHEAADALDAMLAASPQGEGDWITHDGGPNPVPGKMVEFICGVVDFAQWHETGVSDDFVWDSDVVPIQRYRVTEGVKP